MPIIFSTEIDEFSAVSSRSREKFSSIDSIAVPNDLIAASAIRI